MFLRLKNYISSNTGLLVRLDDICENMNWQVMFKLEDLFKKYKIKPVLGVISNNQDKELLSYPLNNKFWDKIREWHDLGWEISIHGYSHVYSNNTEKKDFFNYGGRSEFYGKSLSEQKTLIKNALDKFKSENVQTRSFFSPNHTYDLNTFRALKECGIKNIIDGYGLFPFKQFDMIFIPQLFYKEILLPFGIQTTQIHINYLNELKFKKLKEFLITNNKKIISFDEAIQAVNNNFVSRFSRIIFEKSLKLIRKLKN
tara:strand:- start:63 stop:830 length:768 start_codon:yes stop_codon:yes gene_type:complete